MKTVIIQIHMNYSLPQKYMNRWEGKLIASFVLSEPVDLSEAFRDFLQRKFLRA